MNTRNITDYYEKDVPAYASYDNIRKLCGIDGLKLSQRKIVWAGFKRCYNDWLKTDTMCAQTQIDTNYIHGATNLEVVIDGMTAAYVGSNNYPLLIGNSGGFGCRISPRPSAGRYTRVKMSSVSKALFDGNDNQILEKQFFEGQYIEPKYLLPIFPVMFLNGAEGLSTGFSQKIYPRNPDEVIEYVKKRLNGTENPRLALLPWFRGHLGKVAVNKETGTTESFGVVTKNNMNSYTISELPIGVDYQKYVEQLDKFCESDLIQDYSDKCDPKTDKILFEIKTSRDFTRKHEDERSLYEELKLIKSLPETLCCIDENNRVREFESVEEILNAFIDLRLKYYGKHKEYFLKTIKTDVEKLVSKYLFVQGIVKKTIVVANKKKAEIEAQLEKNDKIIKVDGTYDFLLSMPIHSLTTEKLEELKKQIDEKKELFKTTKETTVETMWTSDMSAFKKSLCAL